MARVEQRDLLSYVAPPAPAGAGGGHRDQGAPAAAQPQKKKKVARSDPPELTLARAAKSAMRRNRRNARRYPLLNQAGILDQVVQPMTAEAMLELQQLCRDEFRARMAQAEMRALARVDAYRAALYAVLPREEIERLAAAFEASMYPKSAEYRAGYWYQLAHKHCGYVWSADEGEL